MELLESKEYSLSIEIDIDKKIKLDKNSQMILLIYESVIETGK